MSTRRVTTAEIVAGRALEEECGQECVEWAVTMLIEGRDTPHLRVLAGMLPPHNHFQLADLRDKALSELGEPSLSRDRAIVVYARERLHAALADDLDLPTEIETVAQLCIAGNYLNDLFDFYLLWNAHDDLKTSELQWYWPGADRSNILEIMKRRAEEFIRRSRPLTDVSDAM
jgi:hypothetical protein